MFISLWLFIPAVIVVILGARESWKNSTALGSLKSERERDQRIIEGMREEIALARGYVSRCNAAIYHVRDVARREGNETMLDAAHEAVQFYNDESKGREDAPWLK